MHPMTLNFKTKTGGARVAFEVNNKGYFVRWCHDENSGNDWNGMGSIDKVFAIKPIQMQALRRIMSSALLEEPVSCEIVCLNNDGAADASLYCRCADAEQLASGVAPVRFWLEQVNPNHPDNTLHLYATGVQLLWSQIHNKGTEQATPLEPVSFGLPC